MSWQGKKIYDRDGKQCGTATGHVERCRLEECPGDRIRVRWPDDHCTWPCERGLQPYLDGWKIV